MYPLPPAYKKKTSTNTNHVKLGDILKCDLRHVAAEVIKYRTELCFSSTVNNPELILKVKLESF